MIPGISFRMAVITADEQNIVALSVDKGNRDGLSVFNANNGTLVQKIPLKSCNIKVKKLTYCSMS